MARPDQTHLPTSGVPAATKRILRRLARLRAHRIAPGEVDIRGWIALAEDGRRVGRVRDVIVDIDALAVRYVELCLDPHLTSGMDSRRLVVPVGCARVSAHRPQVHLHGITTRELLHAPRYGAGTIGSDEENILRAFFLRPSDADGSSVTNASDAEGVLEQQFWGARRRARANAPYLTRCNPSRRS
jgi:hypothetical protein